MDFDFFFFNFMDILTPMNHSQSEKVIMIQSLKLSRIKRKSIHFSHFLKKFLKRVFICPQNICNMHMLSCQAGGLVNIIYMDKFDSFEHLDYIFRFLAS